MEKYRTIDKTAEAEIVEKKSKFIANIYYIKNEEEANEIIKDLRKKYYDARHVCYAYSTFDEKENIKKSSDDGEPSGTAGAPILNIIEKNNLKNILITVVRYFGGILLGTGGLVKAYTESALKALDNTEIVEEEFGKIIQADIQYNQLEKFKYFCKKQNIKIKDSKFENIVTLFLEVNEEDLKKIMENNEKKSLEIKKINVVKECIIRKNVDI